MKRPSRLIVIGLTTTLLAASSMAAPTVAAVRHRHHRTVKAQPSEGPQTLGDADPGAADAARNGGRARGLYAGAGGIFSPDYQVPDYGTVQLGAQLLGGDFGKAYEDYYRHYYYYKYAYCPIGTGYVIYSRSCVGIGNLFQ